VNPWNLLLDIIGTILAFFYQIIPFTTGAYGIAIILLTLTVSLVMFPLTLKQTRSMRAMQDIQPEVKRLQKEYKADREELNKQLMALYQERGVNPAAGCLPLLVQMPIWFALFSVLRTGNGIPEDSDLAGVVDEARDALEAGVPLTADAFDKVEFLGMNLLLAPSQAFQRLWPDDFLGLVPYIILILIIVGAGYYQQVQTTRARKNGAEQPQAAQGMQTAMKIMPIFFGFISWSLPSGLGLYFGTSNLFRIGQQALILRMDEGGDEKEEPATPPSDSPKDEGTNSNGGPSQHASKKRNRRRRK
jgi:YidC/Oxa1 family membrane protein insertase